MALLKLNNSLIKLGNDLIGMTIPTPVFPTSGLTSYWRFDETGGTIAYDSVGSNDITFNKTVVLTSGGKNNNCATADGLSDTYGNGKPLNILSGSFNVSGWFKKNINTNHWSRIFFIGDLTNTIYHGLYFQVFPTTFVIEYGDGLGRSSSNRKAYSHSYTFNDYEWYHFSFNHRSITDFDLYINNDKIPSSSTLFSKVGTATTIDWKTGNFCVFRLKNNYQYGKTSLDEFAIWDRELTDEEVAELYNSGNGTFY